MKRNKEDKHELGAVVRQESNKMAPGASPPRPPPTAEVTRPGRDL